MKRLNGAIFGAGRFINQGEKVMISMGWEGRNIDERLNEEMAQVIDFKGKNLVTGGGPLVPYRGEGTKRGGPHAVTGFAEAVTCQG